ncbi:sensor histidine kinase [Isoptericola sp. b441]|uniref:Oxygen sensor histidine kinase NreB n=1 Tax=Actinotalea lenta TaxID=3064654 RepID=A0ABT9D4Y9_9CELL|nr:sensor histidine kinase [Isoptericola sp. b441]MDO8105753.1 sensor histidine kinase [Isoptericola sp. b441]
MTRASRAAAGRSERSSGLGPSLADPDDRSRFWHRSMRGWDVAFYLMTGLTAFAVLAIEDSSGPSVAVALAVLAGLVLAYVGIGRRAALTDNRRLVWLYLAILLVAVTVVSAASIAGSVLLFVGFSQIWFFAPNRRAGVGLVVALAVAVFTAIGVRSGVHTPQELGALLTQGGVTIAFAVLLGLWVTQIAERSEERAALVERLEAAQTELAHSHHAAGVMAERERMAQEIHDTLAQGFTSIVMLSQAIRSDVERDRPESALQRLDLVERTARENLAEARALVAAFAPVGLSDGQVGEALRRLADRFADETGLAVQVHLPQAMPAVGREREVILLRAAQEALTNVRRHADASSVLLMASPTQDGGVTLEVADDGRGIPAEAAEGFGLRGMRDRVTSGGGDLDVSSRSGGGTRVLVTLPGVPSDGAERPEEQEEERA